MDKVQKIRAKVERLKSLIGSNSFLSDYEKGCNYGREDMCDELISFIDSLQEEPVNEDLDAEADKYSNNDYNYFDVLVTEYDGAEHWMNDKVFIKDAFKSGAKWQKEQMMAKAFDAEVLENYDGKCIEYDETILDEKLSDCNVFDKVKVLVIKEG